MDLVRNIGQFRSGIRNIFRLLIIGIMAQTLLSCDTQPSATGQVLISVSLSAPGQHLAAYAAAATKNPFPASITQVDIRIDDATKGTLIALGTIDLTKRDFTVRLAAPAGFDLAITGTAYADSEVVFTAHGVVAALASGASAHVPLQFIPEGPITTRTVNETFQIDVSATDVSGDKSQIDVSATDVSGDKSSAIAIFSSDNHRVAFHSPATNLTPNDTNGQIDVFIKDLVTGEVINAHSNADGTLGNGELKFADISADANVVVFASDASDLVPGDTNGVADIFLKNISANTFSRLSLTVSGGEMSNFSGYPTISDDGKRVSFYTNGSLTEDGNVGVFLVEPLSNGGRNVRHIGDGWLPQLSGDGNWIVYKNIGSTELWLYDVISARNKLILSFTPLTTSEPGVYPTNQSGISQDGGFVVFDAQDSYDDADTNGLFDIYLYNRSNQTLRLVSTDRNGQPLTDAGSAARTPSLSADGRFVTFNIGTSIYVKDAVSGELDTLPSTGGNAFISPNGHLIAFNSEADGHLYIAPNPLLLQPVRDGQPTPPAERPAPGSVREYSLTVVTTIGDGTGKVTSTGGAIDCGTTCSATYGDVTDVTLTAAATTDSHFNGWTGACAGAGKNIEAKITVDGIKSCGATFTLNTDPYSLSVSFSGDGHGSVSSDDGKIACPAANCFAGYRAVTAVKLMPTADANSQFVGWTGNCVDVEGTPDTTVDVNGDIKCTAIFNATNFRLNLIVNGGPGGGTVRTNDGPPVSLSCDNIATTTNTCVKSYPRNTALTLIPTPAGNNNQVGWQGCDSAAGLDGCTLTMNADRTVTARFSSSNFALTVTKSGNGLITDDLNQVNCGADCSGSYANNTQVTLTAAADAGYRFIGWSVDCGGTASTVTVTMNKAVNCTATFLQQVTLTVNPLTNDAGLITSTPAGISCQVSGGTGCSQIFDGGTPVTLAVQNLGSYLFTGWQETACANAATTGITLTADLTCSAQFTLDPLIANLPFSDVVLGNCVSKTAATNSWTRVSQFTSLTCDGVSTLTGIEALTALQQLRLTNNFITDVKPLAPLTALTLLESNASSGADVVVTDITPLASLTLLTNLKLGTTALTDLAPLKALAKLTDLKITGNSAALDVSSLQALTGLVNLDLTGGNITLGVPGLSALVQAKTILLNDNPNMTCTDVISLDKAMDASDGGFAGKVRWNTCFITPAASTPFSGIMPWNSSLDVDQSGTGSVDITLQRVLLGAGGIYSLSSVAPTVFYRGTAFTLGYGGCYTAFYSGLSTASPISGSAAADLVGYHICLKTSDSNYAEIIFTGTAGPGLNYTGTFWQP